MIDNLTLFDDLALPRYHDPINLQTRIERVNLSARARSLATGETSAHGFQAWIGTYKTLAREGWDVEIVVALDGSHAIGLACRDEP